MRKGNSRNWSRAAATRFQSPDGRDASHGPQASYHNLSGPCAVQDLQTKQLLGTSSRAFEECRVGWNKCKLLAIALDQSKV